jgi:TPR repeat protein
MRRILTMSVRAPKVRLPAIPLPALRPEGGNLRRRRRVALTAAAACALMPLLGCDQAHPFWGRRLILGGACPRPATGLVTSTPQFNQQQQEIRLLRQRGFRGDFFAQLELARRYEAVRASDKNLEDPVEAATWYALALANSQGYDPISARLAPGRGQRSWADRLRAATHFDDCRAFERGDAYAALNRLLNHMSSDERDKVRDRAIYVLSTEGPEGYRTLARLHDAAFGPFGEPIDNVQALYASRTDGPAAPPALGLFTRNDVDAYLYNYLAAQSGDVGAYVLMKDFERATPERAGFSNLVETKADRWIPPYEFYPPESPNTGVPHTDESFSQSEAADYAQARIRDLPFVHVAEAFAYLRISPKPWGDETHLPKSEIMAFQAMLGRPQTGWLTPLEKVRAIQFAAVNGSAKAQLVLAVMYAEGVGVVSDYARAFHWFEMADRQGSGEAKFAMSQFFSLGVQGVADQDKAKAVVYQIDAALSGFHPSADRLQQVLQRMNRRRFGGGFVYGRGAPCCGAGGYGPPPPGYGGGYGGPPQGVESVTVGGPYPSPPPYSGPTVVEGPYGPPPAYGRR